MENDQTQISPAAVVPTTPPVIDPHDVKPKFPLVSVIMGLVILILIAVIGFLVYQNMQIQKQFIDSTKITPSPVSYISPTPYVTATASAIPTTTASTTTQGTITGSICYPASGIPAGKVVAKNTVTNALTSFDNVADNSSFSITLPTGQYKLRYEPTAYPTVIGYYTSCTGSEPSCKDNSTKRASIITTVTSGQTAQGVKLCDYYYQAGMEPDF